MEKPQRIRVGVVYGGRSTEHSVSCVSAGAVISHLDPEKYEVIPIGITSEGMWTLGAADPTQLQLRDGKMPTVPAGEELALSLNPATRGHIRNLSTGKEHAVVDVVFPVLHGQFGEDGTIQGLLELSGVAYVGTGVLSSACGMDKEFTKKLAAAEGLPITAEAVLVGRDELSEQEKQTLGLPVFVKPARGGSSIGVSRVSEWSQLPAAVALARESDPKVIVEAEIIGAEIEVGVLQYPDGRVIASYPAQLNGTEDSDEGFYGFETKYLDDVVTATIPAPVSDEMTTQLQTLAIEAFHALDCDGLARVDFFATESGPVLNEINTMPGFTPISMYPQVFAATGVSYPELLDILIEQALAH
ncbi:D-alanine--D-alanine ligase family protein [Corynebacterium alimapuense]|uniref:D-alanine--D-alanine ligase n=1 Tax=Corynebacterium alimapuense TaxID=1576874 RepID=A0A3M8K523_9CORY|nr:D-alanine--D-alanine ligase family protein [Corynebacterium alimapuense]RNE48327.1 D-alanine--D-alanine ligase [Corynebacterium alimapuense]